MLGDEACWSHGDDSWNGKGRKVVDMEEHMCWMEYMCCGGISNVLDSSLFEGECSEAYFFFLPVERTEKLTISKMGNICSTCWLEWLLSLTDVCLLYEQETFFQCLLLILRCVSVSHILGEYNCSEVDLNWENVRFGLHLRNTTP